MDQPSRVPFAGRWRHLPTTRVGRVLLPVALVVLCPVVLWIIGPEPIQSGPYLQAITTSSAVIARVDRSERSLRVRVWPTSDASAAFEQSESEPTRFHALQVEGLSPQTEYRYVLEDVDGAAGEPSARDVGSFRTAPADHAASVRFVAVGDTGNPPWWFYESHRFGLMRARPALAALGGLNAQWDIARGMLEKDPQLFLHLGDVVYPDGRLSFFEEAFFLPFGELLRTTPAFMAIGNHDALSDGGRPFREVFHPPGDRPSGGELYYSFTWGPVRFIVLNSLGDTSPASPMMRWLENTLAGSAEPWTVVSMHHPIFSASLYPDQQRLKAQLWPVLAKHRVDLLLSGHSHGYQRYKAIQGVTPVIVGGGGANIYEAIPDPRRAAHDDGYGFLMVEISGARLTGELWSHDGERRDHFVIERAEKDSRRSPER